MTHVDVCFSLFEIGVFFMSYSLDLRSRVLAYVSSGGSKAEASRLFGVSRKTIYRWLQLDDPLQYFPRKSYDSKLNKAALARHVEAYPDALLRERAAHFNVHHNTIWFALKAMKITKKNHPLPRSR
jgi:putative transposase